MHAATETCMKDMDSLYALLDTLSMVAFIKHWYHRGNWPTGQVVYFYKYGRKYSYNSYNERHFQFTICYNCYIYYFTIVNSIFTISIVSFLPGAKLCDLYQQEILLQTHHVTYNIHAGSKHHIQDFYNFLFLHQSLWISSKF